MKGVHEGYMRFVNRSCATLIEKDWVYFIYIQYAYIIIPNNFYIQYIIICSDDF